MLITLGEQHAINMVCLYGAEYGYGNLISHLNTAWAKKLVREGMSEESARNACHGTGYPFAMQEDLMQRGEWDETGVSYREKG